MLIRQKPNYEKDFICVEYKIGVKLQMKNIMPMYIDAKGFYFDRKYADIIEAVKKEYVK